MPSLHNGYAGAIREGSCGYSEAFFESLQNATNVAGGIVAGVCDQMRRGMDLYEDDIAIPIHLFHLPTTWQNATAFKLYKLELMEISRFLQKLGGIAPDSLTLKHALLNEESMRQQLKLIFENSPYHEYRKRLKAWNEERVEPIIKNELPEIGRSIAIIGGPLPDEELHLIEMMKPYGLSVAVDGSETGFRAFSTPLDRRLLSVDPFEALCVSQWEGIHGIFQRPNVPFYQWFKNIQTRTLNLKGVLFIRWDWCDLWNGEIQRFTRWCDLPVTTIDISGIDATARNKTRLEAFCGSII